MRRIVLPQAMRVIVPPTGNETIAMVKDTSLLTAVPVIVELYYQTYQFGSRSFQIMPGFVAATIWYLIVCSSSWSGSPASSATTAAASAPCRRRPSSS